MTRSMLLLGFALAAAAFADAADLDRYNVVWDSPSANAHGSMPLGNGDVGINAWVEPTGDLVFYVSKTDAWDENGRLCKIGRIRVTFDPPLPVTNSFRQELSLADGTIVITSTPDPRPSTLRLWVDAHAPVVHLDAEGATPSTCRASVELWRLRERPFGPDDDSHSGGGLAASPFKPTVLPDVVVTSDTPRVVWYHRNTRSVYELGLEVQHLEALKGRFADPLLNHTFGASLRGEGFVADGERAIRSAKPAKRHALSVTVHAARTDTPDAWLAQLDRLEKEGASSFREHGAWWQEFWDRSWIFVSGSGSLSMPLNAHPWRVGAASDGGSRFGGGISEPRVIGRALSAEEIAALAARPRSDASALEGADAALSNGCTAVAWIKPAPGEAGRILDKCTAGKPDGLTFDTHPGLSLRWIVGDHTMIHPNCLKPGEWQHVAATVDAASGVRRLYLGGELVKEERGDPAGEIVTRGYVLQRFMNACSGRGGSPIKFNGSIFTVEATPGAPPETPAGDPDWRRWGGNYWFQNTRLAYWPMLAAGDFEMMEPWFRMYRDALPLSLARIKTYYGFDNAAQFPETMYAWGLPNNGDYGWNNKAPEPANSYIARYWNGSLELIAAMLDRYDFTQDLRFAKETLVPLADPLINFLDRYWPKRDENGKIRFDPAQSLETWHSAVNPLPEIAGLRFLLPRLLALPKGAASDDQRARWTKMLGELPPVPVAEVNGVKLLRPAETFSRKSNSENTELYAVFPYRLYGVGRPDLDMARATYAARGHRHNLGWCQDSIQAACLGLGDEAARLVTARASQRNGYRFPVMWGPNFDWVPDQDHGNNILTTLQYMLLQSDGEKIFVLPAWPKPWNVAFKLHAPRGTTVEGVYRDGKLERLDVTPASRRKDIVPSPT
jgi:hypothetical protein